MWQGQVFGKDNNKLFVFTNENTRKITVNPSHFHQRYVHNAKPPFFKLRTEIGDRSTGKRLLPYGQKTWSPTLTENHAMQTCEKEVLKRISDTKMYVVTWRCKNVHIYELYNWQAIRHESLLRL